MNENELDLLLQKEDYESNKTFYNERAKKYSLDFNDSDITYIIVHKIEEIHDMLVFLNDIGIKTPKLCTKIISLEQIENDI